MKAIELMLPRVLVKAAACPDPLAIRALRDAARTFLRRTRLWRETITIEAEADNSEEDVVPSDETDDQAAVYEIFAARFGEDDNDPIALAPKTVAWLDLEAANWRTEEGTPAFFTQLSQNTVAIAPRADGDLLLDLILEPAEAATEVPDFVVDQHAEVIADGALAEILTTPGDFQNPQLALDHRKKFNDALDKLAAKASRGQQRAPRRTRRDADF